jgi:hypothetical protein
MQSKTYQWEACGSLPKWGKNPKLLIKKIKTQNMFDMTLNQKFVRNFGFI